MISALNNLYGFCEGVTQFFKGARGPPPTGGGEGTSRTPYGGGTLCKIFGKVSGRGLAAYLRDGADHSGVSQMCFISVFSKHIAL